MAFHQLGEVRSEPQAAVSPSLTKTLRAASAFLNRE